MLNKSPEILISAIAKVRSTVPGRSKFFEYLDSFQKYGDEARQYVERSDAQDRLFEADYLHRHGAKTCSKCDASHEEHRTERPYAKPRVHYGTIASGNQVIKDAVKRHEVADTYAVICCEMEAAGLMDHFRCLVIRAICDYGDSHKNKAWQPYAAAIAASWAKELLRNMSAAELQNQERIE